jgi:glyoxylase-like metal-dependent hydrolase (beta-lactamase superfamily II)
VRNRSQVIPWIRDMHAAVLPQGPAEGLCFIPIEGQKTQLIGYLLIACLRGEAVVVDPPCGTTELILALLAEHEARLTKVLRTHVHQVDTDDATALCVRSGARLVMRRGGTRVVDAGHEVFEVEAGVTLRIGGECIHVLSTPGHTPTCVSYLWRDRLFCGDVFDLGSCAVGNNEAEPSRLYDTLTRCVFDLPDETLVFPAHSIKGRRVALLGELRARYGTVLGHSRDAFITEMGLRRIVRPALGRMLPPG